MLIPNVHEPPDSFDVAKKLFATLDALKQALQDISSVAKYAGRQEAASVRTLKVIYEYYQEANSIYGHNYTKVSKIRLCGRWLEKAGFDHGQFVKVITMKNLIIVAPVT